MSWPNVNAVLLMAVKAQEPRTICATFYKGSLISALMLGADGQEYWEGPGMAVRAFDPPSHDGTDQWKWGNG